MVGGTGPHELIGLPPQPHLKYLYQFVKLEGQIGVIVPGFVRELDGPLPEHLRLFWDQDCWIWHDVGWWRNHWSRTDLLDVEVADSIPNVHDVWRQWYQARLDAGYLSPSFAQTHQLHIYQGALNVFWPSSTTSKQWQSLSNGLALDDRWLPKPVAHFRCGVLAALRTRDRL